MAHLQHPWPCPQTLRLPPRPRPLRSTTALFSIPWDACSDLPDHRPRTRVFPFPGLHNVRIFSTSVSGPGRGKNRYVVVGYVDDTEILRFDSDTARPRLEPRVPWMEQPWVELEHPHFWDQKTRDIRNYEKIYGGNVDNLRHYYNQSEDGEPRGPGDLGTTPIPTDRPGSP